MALEAAGLLTAAQLEEHGEYGDWQRQLSSIAHGQASHGIRGRKVRQPEELAHERILRDRRAAAVECQLSALKVHGFQPDTPVDDSMPF